MNSQHIVEFIKYANAELESNQNLIRISLNSFLFEKLDQRMEIELLMSQYFKKVEDTDKSNNFRIKNHKGL